MNKIKPVLLAVVVLSQAIPALAGVNVDINIETAAPPTPVVVAPAPVYAPPPMVYAPAPGPVVVYESQPRFIFSPTLGFYVSVGVPYDIVYIGPSYYLYSGGYWYMGATYVGPWVLAKQRMLPPGLRRFSFDKIRYYRDFEYKIYLRDPVHYRGRLHEPVWKRVDPREMHREEPRRENQRREGVRDERREEFNGYGERRR